MKPKLSLAIICRDEERDLPHCLDSVRGLVDEIVLVDDHSTDRTKEIAEGAGAVVHRRRFTNYAEQKQFALDHAAGPWILHLDADERLSEELREEIKEVFDSKASGARELPDAFELKYDNRFLGGKLRFGGLANERHVRLFRKDKARFKGGRLHEGLEVDGRVERLAGRVIHFSYRDLHDYLRKMNRYTTLAAEKMHASGRRWRAWHALALPLEFWKRYLLQLGFLDGYRGLVWCFLCGMYQFTKYQKLRELEREAAA